jgi:hypothetical protein
MKKLPLPRYAEQQDLFEFKDEDIGGATWSGIHKDILMTQPTVALDEKIIMDQGKLSI